MASAKQWKKLTQANPAPRGFAVQEEAGKVEMPLQATDWSPAYGQLQDRFGLHFQINTEAKP